MTNFEYEYFIPEDIGQFSDPLLAEAEMLDSIQRWVEVYIVTFLAHIDKVINTMKKLEVFNS